MWFIKWCHLTEICFVRGMYFGYFANSISPLLSSKVVVYELHESNFIPNTLDASNIICINWIKSLMLLLRMIHSYLVVDKAMSLRILLTQPIGLFANLLMFPVLDKTDPTWSASSIHHAPENVFCQDNICWVSHDYGSIWIFAGIHTKIRLNTPLISQLECLWLIYQ